MRDGSGKGRITVLAQNTRESKGDYVDGAEAMTEEIVLNLLGLRSPQSLALSVGTQVVSELLRHPVVEPSEPIALLSHTPGRLRLRVAALKRSQLAASRIATRLSTLPGIKSVEANPLTATVLVTFDRQAVGPREIRRAVDQAVAAFRVVRPDSEYRLPMLAELALTLV